MAALLTEQVNAMSSTIVIDQRFPGFPVDDRPQAARNAVCAAADRRHRHRRGGAGLRCVDRAVAARVSKLTPASRLPGVGGLLGEASVTKSVGTNDIHLTLRDGDLNSLMLTARPAL